MVAHYILEITFISLWFYDFPPLRLRTCWIDYFHCQPTALVISNPACMTLHWGWACTIRAEENSLRLERFAGATWYCQMVAESRHILLAAPLLECVDAVRPSHFRERLSARIRKMFLKLRIIWKSILINLPCAEFSLSKTVEEWSKWHRNKTVHVRCERPWISWEMLPG